MKHTKSMIYKPSIESQECFIVTVNNYSNLYYNYVRTIVLNLHKKYVKGTFDKEKAVDAFYPVTVMASKSYIKDYGYGFDVTARFTASTDMVEYYMENIIKGDL